MPPPDYVSPFSISTLRTPAGERLVLTGELDLATVPDLRRRIDELAQKGQSRIELDFTAVDYIDSSGLAALVRARQRLTGDDPGLVLIGLSPNLRHILELTGLISFFEFGDE
jgi:anti-sigma B factor antagonist